MSYTDFSIKTKTLIAGGDLKAAIKLLTIETGETFDPILEKEAISLAGQHAKVESDRINNVLSYDEESRAISKITAALLLLIDKLDDFHGNPELQGSAHATENLRNLVHGLRAKSTLLSGNDYFVQDLKMIFEEITKTYKVILDVITRFVSPALDPQNFNLNNYSAFERGEFNNDVQDGRGHCHVIFQHYQNGLRDFLSQKIGNDSEDFQEIDQIFTSLANADYTVFDQMAQIGHFIESESKTILDLLGTVSIDDIRTRVLQDRKKLRDLEDELKKGISEVRELKIKLGYGV